MNGPVWAGWLCLRDSESNFQFFYFQDTKYEALIEQLDRYSKQGIPQNVDYPQGQSESIDAIYKLEEDWRDIIMDYSGKPCS